jgi:hypothetical protein
MRGVIMESFFKKVIKATFLINNEEAPPEPDPISDFLQKALPPIVPLQKAVINNAQPVFESPNQGSAQKLVPRDPLVRLIQETDDKDSSLNVRSEISGAVNSYENGIITAIESNTRLVDNSGNQAQASGVLTATNNQHANGAPAIQEKQLLNNEAALQGERSDFNLKPGGKTAIPAGQDPAFSKDTPQTNKELSGNQAQATSQGTTQNTTGKSLPTSEGGTGPVLQEKAMPAKQVNEPPKKGGSGDIMDIFLEEEKKEKNEVLLAGLENIESQKLLNQAENILASLKMKVKR